MGNSNSNDLLETSTNGKLDELIKLVNNHHVFLFITSVRS